MAAITPGIVFLARRCAFLAVAGCFFVALGRYITYPLWALVFLTYSSGPVIFILQKHYLSLRDQRDAAALGARIFPKVKGKWIGNFDILTMMKHNWNFGYPGESFLFFVILGNSGG